MEETFTNAPQPAAEQPQGIILLQDAQAYLVTAGKWARFLGILGFIATGFVTLGALFIGTMMSAMSTIAPRGPFFMLGAAAGGFMTVFYLLIAVLNFFCALYLYQFGTRVKNGVAFQNSGEVTSGLGKLKSLFKLVGIVTIIILVLYLLIFIGAIAFASHMTHATTPDFGS
ncbi:DUF5362 family protein [Mucilaginibacter ximonensis]|uniref:DUF5362 family protein n=1 Tax=Mucilaginibacter ximonensis TaxID=538021 RepID=A0ABW5Y6X9_9SPHI